MRCTERIVFAFGSFGKTAQPAALAKCADANTTTGENLVGIALMPNVPDQLVARCIEYSMDGDGQFDDAQPGAQMTTCYGHCRNRFSAKFIGHSTQLAVRKVLQVLRLADFIQQRRGGSVVGVGQIGLL